MTDPRPDLTVAVLRDRATGMPHRHQAKRAELIAWLQEHRPEALTGQRLNLLACPTCGSIMSDSNSATAEWTLAEHLKREHPESPTPAPAPTLLPAPFADSAGALDVDGLRTLTARLRADLVESLRISVRDLRAARGTVVTEEDTYDVVRRLTDAGEVLRRLAEVFLSAASEADALTAEEVVIAHGEDEGIPRASLFVPDGAGQRIAVRADWGKGSDTWDVGSLVGWIAEDEAMEQVAGKYDDLSTEQEDVAVKDYAEVARTAMERLLALGRFNPSVTAIEAVRLRAAERQDDSTAALLRQIRTKGERIYRGVKITREPLPKSQQAGH
jgi:hypothetical protein